MATSKPSPAELLELAKSKSIPPNEPKQELALIAQLMASTTSEDKVDLPTETIVEVKDPVATNPELEILRRQLAESQAKLAVANTENAVLQAKMPVDNFITLRSSIPHFSVIIDNERYLFRNGTFKTLDPTLAARIVSTYQGITQDAKYV